MPFRSWPAELPIDPWVVPCGFPSLAPFVQGGFRAGELVVIGGDAGSGVSSLALAIALRAGAMRTPVAVLSGEHTHLRLAERSLAAVSRVPVAALRGASLDPAAKAAVAETLAHLREQAPLLAPLGREGIVELERVLDAAPETRLLVVDGAESLLTDPGARDDALAYAVLACKRLAISREVVVLLTAHLPDFDRGRQILRPTLADFGVRGAIGTHADLVLGLFREEIYFPDEPATGAAELHLLKHRTGAAGYIDLYFDAPCLRFEDVIEA